MKYVKMILLVLGGGGTLFLAILLILPRMKVEPGDGSDGLVAAVEADGFGTDVAMTIGGRVLYFTPYF